MDTNEVLKMSLEHFERQRQKRIEEMLIELEGLETTIRQIQAQLGITPEERQNVLPPTPGAFADVKAPALQPPSGSYKPRPDEFFNMPQADAARAYLEKIGHALSLDKILSAITGGGCKVGGADPRRTLMTTLLQRKADFVNTGGGNWGLRKFYPNMPKLGRPTGATAVVKNKRGHAKKAASRSKAKPKARGKPVIEVSKAPKAAKPPTNAPDVQVIQ